MPCQRLSIAMRCTSCCPKQCDQTWQGYAGPDITSEEEHELRAQIQHMSGLIHEQPNSDVRDNNM